MVQLRFAVYYENHPEYRDISAIKYSSHPKTRPVQKKIGQITSISEPRDNSLELKAILSCIDASINLTHLNLRQFQMHLSNLETISYIHPI